MNPNDLRESITELAGKLSILESQISKACEDEDFELAD
jgi:hypothetical protein